MNTLLSQALIALAVVVAERLISTALGRERTQRRIALESALRRARVRGRRELHHEPFWMILVLTWRLARARRG